MSSAPPRPLWQRPPFWGALAAFTVFGALTALVAQGDPSFRDEERIRELQQRHLSAGGPAGDDWPQWRGPNRDGVSPAKGLLPRWPDDLLTSRKLWEAKTGAGFSSPAIAQGRSFLLVQDGDHEAVVCWDARTGEELWRFRYPCNYVNDNGSGPRSTPTVDSDCVYTVGATGLLHCLKVQPRTSAGEAVWAKDLLRDFGAENLRWGVSFSPLVLGDLVYVNPGGPNNGSLAALNKRDGTVAWQTLNDRAGYSSPVAATLAGKPQVVFFTGEAAVGVSPTAGTVFWRFPWTTDYGINAATPIVVDDYVLLTSGYGRGCCLLKIEADGQGVLQPRVVYRNKRLGSHFGTPVRYGDYLYGFDDSLLVCLDFRTGAVRWKERDFDKGSLLVADGRLIVLGEYGKLALAEATPEGYHEISALAFSQDKCWTMPVLAQGRLYVRDQQRLVCLDLRDQRLD
jgi:outer membrane protein assembly factor BamB